MTLILAITARKRSCGKVMFLHMSVNLFTGGPPSGTRPPWDQTHLEGTGDQTGSDIIPQEPQKRVVRILLDFSLKISYSTHVRLVQLDRHQTCKPGMVSQCCEFKSVMRSTLFLKTPRC